MPTPALTAYLDAREQAYLDDLLELLRIPSVSTNPAHAADMAATAAWIADRLRAAGCPTVQVMPTGGHPVVYGLWPAADPNARRILVYGHYDVQPPDPLELWTSAPFEPTVRDGRLYARGAADMKANLLTSLHAAEALAAVDGAPPVTLVFLYEGEEEIGSPNLRPFVAAHREMLACDAVVNADGLTTAFDRPSLMVGVKGMCGMQIDVRIGRTDLHSGGYGARVPNANQVLVQLAATFHDASGRVAVAGFYDRVPEMTADERAAIAASVEGNLPVTEESGAYTTWGEAGYTDAERGSARPTLDINGMWGGYQGDGIKTVTPCEAHMKISCRLVPNQDPAEILDLIEAHVAKHALPGVEVTCTKRPGLSIPFLIPRDHFATRSAADAMRVEYGREPLYYRVGGSVPITAVFKNELGADSISVGFGENGCGLHAPDEWYTVAAFPRSRRVYVDLYRNLATLPR
jgi:acetylornithine deacetylase/succinyl-diaminopimelate desuccinylase-like protein